MASPFRTLTTFVHDAVHSLTTEPSSCLCMQTSCGLESNDPEIHAVIAAYDAFTCAFLKNLIDQTQAHNEIACSADAATVAEYLNSAFAGGYNTYFLHRDRAGIQAITDFASP